MARDGDYKLTREYLFNLVADRFSLIEKHLHFSRDRETVISVFRDSSKVAHVLEREVDKREKLGFDTILSLLGEIVSPIVDDSFHTFLSQSVHKAITDKYEKKDVIDIRAFVVAVFRKMAEFHNSFIDKMFAHPWFKIKNDTTFGSLPQTFLSYSYDDKGLSLGLFLYFLINGGFLYVNWMWSGVNKNSSITKDQLEDVLEHSDQFLFLRTLNSELDYYGRSQIRQWCSWEIGNYYTKKKDEKYIVNFYGSGVKENDLLSTFKSLAGIANGRIVG